MKYKVTFHPSLVRTIAEIHQKGISTKYSNLVNLVEKTFWNIAQTDGYEFEVDSPLDLTEVESEITSDLVEYVTRSSEKSMGLRHLFAQKFCYDLENLGIEVQVQ